MTAGGRRRLCVLLLAIASFAVTLAPSARAAVGYELDPVNPSHNLDGVPRGLAVDQANQDLYVAIITKNFSTLASGQIERFNSDLSADGIFAQGSGYFSGVAVNPVTHGFYGAEVEFRTQFGNFGASKLDRFSSAGALAGSTAVAYPNALPTIAADSAGNVFYPNREKHSVQVFDSAGVLQEEITCGGCPGGQFGAPISVAVNAGDDLYVADAAPDRVIKLTSSGGPYSFGSLVQSGRGAGAVGVDPGTGDVLVGDLPNGKDFHIVAYSSSGTQFDDFGRGLFADPAPEAGVSGASQMAVDATTHRLYVSTFEKFYIFDRVTIHPPTATIGSATNVAQLSAKMNATVNTGGHAVLECEFEYTDDEDFQANGYANATAVPCSTLPYSTGDTPVEAKASGLQSETTYHFRVSATNNAGAASSNSETFETLQVVPATVTTESPTAVTQTGATLKGKVNPHGGSASNCHFELGTSISYGTNLSCSSLPGSVSTDVAESRSASGLGHDVIYHYRLVVTTNAGTVKGNDVEFTTASPPSDPEPPADPTPPPADTSTQPPPVIPPSGGPAATPPPLHCKKGFRKRRVRGKVRCVRKKRVRSSRGRRVDLLPRAQVGRY
jgi:hypothetical protein